MLYQFLHPYGLADGTLVVLATNKIGGSTGNPCWLFRYSAAGVLQQRYAFASPLLPSPQSGTAPANIGLLVTNVPGMQPLSDFTFMLTTTLYWYRNNQIVPNAYLAHLKVPGLRRVIDSHYIPAANSARAARAATAAFPASAYPNPARETVPLPASRAAGQLVLADLAGRRVLAGPVAAGATAAPLPVSGVAAGLTCCGSACRGSRVARLLRNGSGVVVRLSLPVRMGGGS